METVEQVNKLVDLMFSFDMKELENEAKFLEDYEKTKRENELLKERVAYLERSINRKEDIIRDLRLDVQLDKYEDVIKGVREYIEKNSYFEDNIVKSMIFKDYSNGILQILDKVKIEGEK